MSSIKSAIRSKAFYIGLLVVVLFFGAVYSWSLFNAENSLKNLEENLASQSVLIDRESNITASNPPISEPEEVEIIQPPESPQDVSNSEAEDNQPIEENNNEAPEATASKAMIEAPLEGLYERTADGKMLPIAKSDNSLTPFQAYKKHYTMPSGNKRFIAIAIDDYGLSAEKAELLLQNIPDDTTLIVSPYASSPMELQKKIRQSNHEIWLKLPFQTKNFPMDDQGAKTILSRTSLGNNTENLKWALSQTTGYAGIAAYIDNTFLSAKPMVNSLAREIFSRGLGFFDMNVAPVPTIKDAALSSKAPYVQNNIIFLDQKWNGNFSQAFDLLESIAQSKGYAVGVMAPYPKMIQALNEWESSLAQKNIELIPLSQIAYLTNPTLPKSDMSAVAQDNEAHANGH